MLKINTHMPSNPTTAPTNIERQLREEEEAKTPKATYYSL